MPALNADTAYGPTFLATALTSTFFLAVAAAVLGIAIARTSPRLRWHGIAYAALIPAFALTGFVLQPVQPFTGFALAVITAALAVRLPHTMPPAPAPNADATSRGQPSYDRSAHPTRVELQP